MEAKELRNTTMTTRDGETVTVLWIDKNMAIVEKGIMYHISDIKAVDLYGRTVTIYEIEGDMLRTNKGMYGASNVFIGGKSVSTLLNEE
jgi:hypothetical protein